jgi:hypothetical protein
MKDLSFVRNHPIIVLTVQENKDNVGGWFPDRQRDHPAWKM